MKNLQLLFAIWEIQAQWKWQQTFLEYITQPFLILLLKSVICNQHGRKFIYLPKTVDEIMKTAADFDTVYHRFLGVWMVTKFQ